MAEGTTHFLSSKYFLKVRSEKELNYRTEELNGSRTTLINVFEYNQRIFLNKSSVLTPNFEHVFTHWIYCYVNTSTTNVIIWELVNYFTLQISLFLHDGDSVVNEITSTCSKSTIERLENDVILVLLLSTLNRFYTFFLVLLLLILRK